MGEPVGAKALHPPAFMVDQDQQVTAHGLDVGAQRRQLLTVLPVASEQDHPADPRMAQAVPVGAGQGQPGHIDDERRVDGFGVIGSRHGKSGR